MRIAILTSYPLDVCVGSGVVRTLQGFAVAFRSAGHTCNIIHPQSAVKDFKAFSEQRLEFNNYLKSVKLSSYDLIIGSDFDGYTIDLSEVKDYVVFNGGLFADIIRFEKGETKNILRKLAEKEMRNAQKARLIFVPSKYSAQMVSRYYHIPKGKIKAIPLGIDLKDWKSLLKNTPQKRKQNENILCVAKQYPRKGINDLICAFALLLEKRPGARLTLVGGGPELERNKILAEELNVDKKIHFYGDMNDRIRLSSIYKKSALFCLPSYHETFGLVFLEAMAAGLPVVTYKSTAIPEVVSEEYGFLIESGDIPGLTSRIEELLTDKNLALRMGRNGYLKAKGMTWHKVALAFIKEL